MAIKRIQRVRAEVGPLDLWGWGGGRGRQTNRKSLRSNKHARELTTTTGTVISVRHFIVVDATTLQSAYKKDRQALVCSAAIFNTLKMASDARAANTPVPSLPQSGTCVYASK